MKKIFEKLMRVFVAAVLFTSGCAGVFAIDLKDVLGDMNIGDVVGNVVEGVFTKSDLTMSDIYGQWTSDGSAVCFKGDDLLKKAGGIAAAAALESKINPYYEKLGLNNAVLTINADDTFSLKTKRVTLTGTVTAAGDGLFNFNFKAFGKVTIGSVPAYVQKSVNHLDVMFDASKLKNIISAIAKVSNISIAKTMASMLDSYDGLCLGFSMNKTGSVAGAKSSTVNSGSKTTDGGSSVPSTSELGDKLFEILKGGK